LQRDSEIEPMLRDCDYGRWAGRSLDELEAQEPEALAEWLNDPSAAPHGGESIISLMTRVAEWLDALSGSHGKILAVTHAAVIRAAVTHAIGAPPRAFWRIDIAPLSLTRLSGDYGRWTLASIGALDVEAE
jgi:broad specificity phosphatase PhoE